MNRSALPGTGLRRGIAVAALALAVVNVTAALLKLGPGRHGLARAALAGAIPGGARFLLLLAALLLLASLPGLLRAKRMAWLLAVAATLLSFVVHPLRPRDPDDVGAILALGLVVTLVLSSRLFPARSDQSRVRQGFFWLFGGELFVFLVGFIGLYVVDPELVEPVDLREATANALRLLFIVPAATVQPVSRHGQYFVEAIRSLSMVVLAVSAWHFVHPVLNRALVRPAERQRVRELLEGYASTSLAHFHLLDDKTYYFSDDREAFLSFRLVGSTAIVLGEPVGKRESARQAAQSFVEFCALNGWRIAFHQVTAEGAVMITGLGLQKLKIGEEAVIPLHTFDLAGKTFKHLRNEQNGLTRGGFSVEELAQPLPDRTVAELLEVSEAWMAAGGHRERKFTLGQFDVDYLRQTRVFAVRGPAGRIEAFANVLPRYQSRDGTFDLMRRRPDCANGVMDLLILHFIRLFQGEGCEGLNLGLAPLANIEGSGPVAAALRLIYQRGSSAFNFRGLRDYKEKWKPRWEDRFLVYRTDLDLVPVALAVARVGEQQNLVAQVTRSGFGQLGRRLRPT